MKLSYDPALKKGLLHILQINGERFVNTTAKKVLEFAEAKGISRYHRKLLIRAINSQEPLVITESTTFEDFEKELHLFITDHPYYQEHGAMMSQKSNEKMQLRYTFNPSKDGDKKMVIEVRENMFQN